MRPEIVTFECAGCNETVTGPESQAHYCEECQDGPFCKKCWKKHEQRRRIAPPSKVSDWMPGLPNVTEKR